jgi:hypothetical protein
MGGAARAVAKGVGGQVGGSPGRNLALRATAGRQRPGPPGQGQYGNGCWSDQTDTTAMSDLPGTLNRVRQRIGSDVGVTQVVKLRLEPSPAQVELLRGYCGTARAAYNMLLYQVRADLGQRAAEKTYDVCADDMTPALSWHRFGLEKLLRANREQWLPGHE